jgi:hypothetical protein
MEDAAILGYSSTSATMPASNILAQQPKDRWRSLEFETATPAYVEIDLLSAQTFDFVWLGFHNGSTTGEWRVIVDNNSDFSSPTLTTSWQNLWDSNAAMAAAPDAFGNWDRKHSFMEITEQTQRYVRIEIKDDSNPDSYIDVGRVYLAKYWQPQIDNAPGSGIPWPVEEAKRLRTQGKTILPVARSRGLNVSVLMQFLSEDDLMANLYEIARRSGTSGDILYMRDPTSKYAVHGLEYGVLSSTGNVSQPAFSVWAAALTIEGLPGGDVV